MSGPYRESAAHSLACPRCGDQMPSTAPTGCPTGCGVWVDASSAGAMLDPRELAPSRLTSWFREIAPCPACETAMTLRGHDMSRFLGCEAHGFWIDDTTVDQTGLGAPSNAARLAELRTSLHAIRTERALAAERERELAALAAAPERELERRRAEEERARRRAEARAREEARREAAARESKRQRYLQMVRDAALHRPDALVDELMRLDEAVEMLTARIAALEGTR